MVKKIVAIVVLMLTASQVNAGEAELNQKKQELESIISAICSQQGVGKVVIKDFQPDGASGSFRFTYTVKPLTTSSSNEGLLGLAQVFGVIAGFAALSALTSGYLRSPYVDSQYYDMQVSNGVWSALIYGYISVLCWAACDADGNQKILEAYQRVVGLINSQLRGHGIFLSERSNAGCWTPESLSQFELKS